MFQMILNGTNEHCGTHCVLVYQFETKFVYGNLIALHAILVNQAYKMLSHEYQNMNANEAKKA